MPAAQGAWSRARSSPGSESQHEQAPPPTGTAEILQADRPGRVLQLARWGVAPEETGPGFDAPPAAAPTPRPASAQRRLGA
ncbi:hypothetical protein ACPA9J_34695 [Pseudomonas aeruginosa]